MEVTHQVGPPRGIAIMYFRRDDPIGPEEPEGLAQFAPAGQHTGVLHEAELNRPYNTLGLALLPIDVVDGEPLLCPDGGSQQVERHLVIGKPVTVGTRNGHWRERGVLLFLRQDGGNLRAGILRGCGEDIVAALVDISQAQQDSLGLISMSGGRNSPGRRM
jgi:hypothetical protein